MKIVELHEARYIGGGKGSLEWLLKNYFSLKHKATENDPHNEYHTKPGYHIYDRSGRHVYGIETWKTANGEEDWSLTIGKSSGGTMGGAYDPIEELTIYKVDQVWGPE